MYGMKYERCRDWLFTMKYEYKDILYDYRRES